LLTIGAGLVSQIPALLISTAAGIVVTRVASEDGPAHLGRDIARELLANPKAIAIAAVLMLLLAAVPGLPGLPFAALAIIFGFVAVRLLRRGPAPLPEESDSPGRPRRPGLPGTLVAPLVLEAGSELAAALLAPDGAFQAHELPALRQRLFADTGIALPPVVVRASTPLPPRGFALRVHEVPLARGEVPATTTDTAGLARFVAAHLHTLLVRHGHQLVGIQETQALLDDVQRSHPALVREVVPRLVTPAVLTEVLRRLAEEGISLRTLREILDALANRPAAASDPAALTEHVRAGLRRAITFQHADQRGRLSALLLDPTVEDTLREAIFRTPAGNHLALEPQLSRDIVAAVDRALKGARAAASSESAAPVLLTNPEIRPHLRQLLQHQQPDVAVLSFLELAPEAEVRTVGHVRV
jgi:type III secretion protein V